MSDGVADAGPAEASRPDEIRTFEVSGRYLAVAHVDGRWYAFDDACTHHDCPLVGGALDGPIIECDCHGSMFDVRDGRVVRGPAGRPIGTYPVDVVADRLLVRL